MTRLRLDPSLRDLLQVVHRIVPDAHLVGGAIRDLLDGRQPVDLDFVTQAEARNVAIALAREVGGSPFPLDEVRKTWRVVLPGTATVREIDLSTIDGDIEADLRRRDFTVDALAAPLNADGALGEIVDVCGGVEDLAQRRLRMVSEAVLKDDPLRLLRADRLATELSLTVEDETADAIRRHAPSLEQAAAERRRDELVRILATPRSASGIRLMDSLGLLDVLLPELAPARGVDQPPVHHYWDVFDHSVETLSSLDRMLAPADQGTQLESLPRLEPWFRESFRDGLAWYSLDDYLDARIGGCSRRVLIKLAGLLHDVSKPETKTLESDGRVRFFGHSEQGAVKAASICNRLRFGGRESAFVAKLVEEHLRPTQLANDHLPSHRALYRFFRDLGEAAPGCLFLSLADASAALGPRLQPERWRGHIAYISYVLESGMAQAEVTARQPRLITGSDLMQTLGLEPGPEIGRLLSAIDEAIATGEVSSREEAIELARRLTSPPAAASPSPTSERGASGDTTSAQQQRWWQATPDAWQLLKPLAQEKRREPTEAEDRLWQALRRDQLDGLRFRRQHAIDRYIVDFYCSKSKLVVEVDGPSHLGTPDADSARQADLEKLGLQVLRISNDDVRDNLDEVLQRIKAAAAQHLHHNEVHQAPDVLSPSLKSERDARQRGRGSA
ncbi:MAG TPA: DUF559 domain-containing protein [Dehalococcoidia bacterium]|nr:DUF559 domain-containing protein [Dehalococcoidia bacterium]